LRGTISRIKVTWDEVGVVAIAPIVVLLGLPGTGKFNGKSAGIPIPFMGLSAVPGNVRVECGRVVLRRGYLALRLSWGRRRRGWLTPRLWLGRRGRRRRAGCRCGKSRGEVTD
jgi:hypothetical protein